MASNPTPSSRTSSRAASGTPWVRAGVTALAAGILGVGAIAFAQDTRPTDGDPPLMGPPQREAGPRAARGRGPGGPGRGMQAILQKLELTDEQKQQLRDMREEKRGEIQAWAQDNQDALEEARQKMRAARESGDREAMEAAAEAFRGLRKESPMGDLREDLEKVLTDEQKAKLRDLAAERRGGEKPGAKLKQRVEKVEQGLKEGKLPPMFDNVDLSDEQRARIIEILEKTIAEGKAFREANREKIRELMKKAREAHRAGDKEAAEAARNEIRELMNGAPRGKAREAIAEVLTDEQRQQLREAAGKRMKERRDRRGGEGWGPRGGERRGPRGGEPRSDAAPPAEDFGLKL